MSKTTVTYRATHHVCGTVWFYTMPVRYCDRLTKEHVDKWRCPTCDPGSTLPTIDVQNMSNERVAEMSEDYQI